MRKIWLLFLIPSLGAQTIRLDPHNPQYIQFHGKTVALITSGEHYGAVFNADFDYHRYLDALQAAGLNYTRLFGGSYVEVPGKSFGIQRNDLAPAPGRFLAPWARSTTPGYAGGGNKFDLDHWNPEYFERLRSFLAEADKRGIAVEFTLFSSHYDQQQWAYSPFNPANNINGTDAIDWKKLNTLENGNILAHQERYARKLVHEAGAFGNVIFEIANEPWSDRPVLTRVINPFLPAPARDRYPNSIDLPDDLAMAWQERVARWIASEAPTNLIAQNYCNFMFPVKQLIPGVSVVNFHYAYPEAAVLNDGLGKVISYDETGFLGRDDDAYTRQAWNFMLSGGGAFDALDYSFSVGHEDGSDDAPNGPGGGSAEFRHRLRILSEFLAAFPLTEMHRDSATVTHAQGVYARVLSSAHGSYAMYLDGDGPAALTLHLPAGKYSLHWIDVRTGKSAAEDHFIHSGGERMVTSPPFRGGIALRMTRE